MTEEQIENENPFKRYKMFFDNRDMPKFYHNVNQQDDTMTIFFTGIFVNLTSVRLTAEDRNILYESRINPIANFPDGGFVIFGQKNLAQLTNASNHILQHGF